LSAEHTTPGIARTDDASEQTVVAAAIAGYTESVPPSAPNEPPGFETVHRVYGLDPSQAGEATIGRGESTVWLVPGSNGACLVNLEDRQQGELAGVVCNTPGAVDAGLLWTNDWVPAYGTDGSGARVLIGVAPDGNSSVTINWSDGSHTVAPVSDNIYSVPLRSAWTSVTLKNSSRQTTNVPGMPQLP
jgi:hypothetical protein